MMRQSEFKKKLDPELGRYTRQHIYEEGITDVLKSVGSKIFGKTMKKTVKSAAKKGVEKALTSAATKTGEHVGKKAGDKIVQMLTKSNKTPKVTFNKNVETIPHGWYPQNPPAKKRKMTLQEINQRVNSILSGGKII